MALSRSEILAKNSDRPTEVVPVPEWGSDASIRLRCLSSKDRLKWVLARDKALSGEPGPEPSAYAVVLAAVDDDGTLLFQEQDADALAEGRGDVIERLSEKVLELAGVGEQAVEAAKGNSDAPTNSDSASDSPETSDGQSQN